MLSKLCQDCERMFANWTCLPTLEEIQAEVKPEHEFRWDSYQPNAFGLEKGASDGCHLCYIILDIYMAVYQGPQPLFQIGTKFEGLHEFRYRGKTRHGKKKTIVEMGFFMRSSSKTFSKDKSLDAWPGYGDDGHEPDSRERGGKFQFERVVGKLSFLIRVRISCCCQIDLPDLGDEIVPNVESSTGSSVSMDTSKSWLNYCLEHHETCALESKPWIPSRLVKIDYGDLGWDITLCITTDLPPSMKYVSLSHCWGKAKILILTKANFKKLQQGINFSELSKTFQDAVNTTFSLGYRYLWIDSLCIIQDDVNDWNIEALKMQDVYSNSVVTIAATSSPDGTYGCFRDREIRELVPCRIRAPLEKLGDLWESHLGSSVSDVDSLFEEIKTAPLNTRAWVFQERFLAPRMLHFTNRQILWSCRQAEACEANPGFQVLKEPWINDTLFTEGHRAKLKSDFINGFWEPIVTYYSKLNLTQGTDKLPALAGIAQWVQQNTGNTYVAGLWKTGIITHLLWEVVDQGSLERRPAVYRAPSWTWASIGSSIKMSMQPRISTYWKYRGSEESVRAQLAEVVDIQLQYKASPFGEVTGGYLRVRCNRLLAMSRKLFNGGHPSSALSQMELLGDTGHRNLLCSFDVLSDSDRYYWLRMTTFYSPGRKTEVLDEDPFRQTEGLTLISVPGKKGCFQRVGKTVLTWRPSFFDGPDDGFLFLDALPVSDIECEEDGGNSGNGDRDFAIVII